MSKRREFTTVVRKEIMLRARDARGELRCENPKCQAIVRRGEIHHLKEDSLEIDKSRRLTAMDGQFLCIPCHKAATKAFAPVIAKLKRIEAKHVGAGKMKSRGFSAAPPKDRTMSKTAAGWSEMMRRFTSPAISDRKQDEAAAGPQNPVENGAGEPSSVG